MNKPNSKLSELSMDRTPDTKSSYRPKRSKATMFIITVVVMMVGLFAYVGKNHFLPVTEVKVVHALAIKSTGTAIPEGELTFQSAGWVEPAPFAIQVPALVSGVVKSIHTIEGSRVKKGDLIAELIDRDLQLDLEQLHAEKKQLTFALKEVDAEYLSTQAKTKHHRIRIIIEEKKTG